MQWEYPFADRTVPEHTFISIAWSLPWWGSTRPRSPRRYSEIFLLRRRDSNPKEPWAGNKVYIVRSAGSWINTAGFNRLGHPGLDSKVSWRTACPTAAPQGLSPNNCRSKWKKTPRSSRHCASMSEPGKKEGLPEIPSCTRVAELRKVAEGVRLPEA